MSEGKRFTSGLCEFIICTDEVRGVNLSANETMNLLNSLNGENEHLRDYLSYLDKCYYEHTGVHLRNAEWLK